MSVTDLRNAEGIIIPEYQNPFVLETNITSVSGPHVLKITLDMYGKGKCEICANGCTHVYNLVLNTWESTGIDAHTESYGSPSMPPKLDDGDCGVQAIDFSCAFTNGQLRTEVTGKAEANTWNSLKIKTFYQNRNVKQLWYYLAYEQTIAIS